MNQNQLKQIIKEELKKALSEVTYKVGDSILWKGSRVDVIEDGGEATLTIKLSNGKEKLVFRKDTFIAINEGYPTLLPMKNDNKAFEPQADKGVVVNFIRNGNPSERYLKKMLDILKKNDIIFDIDKIKDKDVDMNFTEDPKINPYEMPGGKASSDGYTGD